MGLQFTGSILGVTTFVHCSDHLPTLPLSLFFHTIYSSKIKIPPVSLNTSYFSNLNSLYRSIQIFRIFTYTQKDIHSEVGECEHHILKNGCFQSKTANVQSLDQDPSLLDSKTDLGW